MNVKELAMDNSTHASIVCRFSSRRIVEGCSLSQGEIETFSAKVWKHEDKQKLLNKLAYMMLDWKRGLCIAEHFQCVLLEVLARTKDLVEVNGTKKQEIHLKFSVTLSHLLERNNYLFPFVLQYFKQFGPFFDSGTKTEEQAVEIAGTAYRLLNFSPATFCNQWDWSQIFELAYIANVDVQRYFLQTLAIMLRLSNEEKLMLMENVFEEQNIQQLYETLEVKELSSRTERTSSDIEINEIIFTESDLSGKHTISAHILLPKLPNVSGLSSDLVAVPSMLRNVQAISIALYSQKAVLLEGVVGSGKTSLVEHLASLTGRNEAPFLLKVQLGDQTDSKALIGAYCCSEVPGEFEWRPGILTRAVKKGSWLLLEDIDCAPMDVISVLIPLLESRMLSIPGKGNIQADPEFQLFATRRVGSYGDFEAVSSESSMLDHLWSKVHIEPLKKDELRLIVETKFPNLESISEKLVDVFALLSSDDKLVPELDTKRSSLSRRKRVSTVRDFLKWCTRVNTLGVTSAFLNSQEIFLEAIDCFCAMYANVEDHLSVAIAIGAKLNITRAKVEFLCHNYKPVIHMTPLFFSIGRITLNRNNSETCLKNSANTGFAFTRHSLFLLESISACIAQNEPALLVGETGTGKTSAIQYLASLHGRMLTVVNMSQQSDSTDLFGGFKPMEMKQLVAPFREEFEKLFCKSFSRKENAAFLTHIQQCFGKGKWELLFKLMLHSQGAALEKLSKDCNTDPSVVTGWNAIGLRIEQLRAQLKQAESSLAFSFVEGALVKAMKRGDWVLLDEINLATPETLECLNSILESKLGSVVVLERCDTEPVYRHEDFRMFACMNPANDVGKKDLPLGIRNRFTEIFVKELKDVGDLKTLIVDYLKGLSPTAALVDNIVSFYLEVRKMASEMLTDGSGYRPYYSLRTLCRALKYAARNPHRNVLRSAYEGFCISFLTQLDRSSRNIVQTLIQQKLLGCTNGSSLLAQPLPKPASRDALNFEGYWIHQGCREPIRSPEYVFTVSVKQNLKDLARIVSGRYFPVLIQGETSVGKTSLIKWLSRASGNLCVRINNHEHTDIQEYLGCYTSDEKGKLVFKEGVLVDAMREGYWIILDELNLAPTDVLEALNRLLDDNRELFIPEIQETVKAHPEFMLFATQNPPGLYGGRKILSRAFRNRFVELHFEELPNKELETILHQRCNLPRSYSEKLVNVMLDLQARRRGSTVFAGKHGFITLRDLFRWADRYSRSPNHGKKLFDWDQQLAEDGYFLLAGRCRNSEESIVVKEVIEKHLKRKIELNNLFGHPSTNQLSDSSYRILRHIMGDCPSEYKHVVFTYNMRRLAVLVGRALEFDEPVLLVGETGCGKTTICQLFSGLRNQKLYSVNCHLHTETSDFLGGLRPVRKQDPGKMDRILKLFEWCDGPLVLAMREGGIFLADEISLADDSVLERLNSVLEPERTLVLAEKGNESNKQVHGRVDQITAKRGFQLLATMNPGGDYGKKELSPALRNRFTEIWCPAVDDPADMIEIIEHNLVPGISSILETAGSFAFGKAMIEFVDWFKSCSFGKGCTVTVRDYLSWVQFINVCSGPKTEQRRFVDPALTYVHGAFLVFLDSMGLGMSAPTMNAGRTSDIRQLCSSFLYHQIEHPGIQQLLDEFKEAKQPINEVVSSDLFTISGFSIRRGTMPLSATTPQYALNAPTTAENAARILRALQLHKPILLEGSPGVGKTSLVSALAKAAGYKLVRINLSEQTDISDLFGADLPNDGNQGCLFSWCDGPLLHALKSGAWVVLDELNLASQSVLEGLNACFDHRGEIFIPELGMSFHVQHEVTRFFACQNPLSQGGGRKGLPRSFLNRFTQVYVEPLCKEDVIFITKVLYPDIDEEILAEMITFNSKIDQQCTVERRWGKQGGPWEFNLRDIFRWCDLMVRYQGVGQWNPVSFVHLIYAGRMRTQLDRNEVWELCLSVFGRDGAKDTAPLVHITPSHIQVGRCLYSKSFSKAGDDFCQSGPYFLLHRSLKPLEGLLTCLQMNWLTILIGPTSCGKTSLVRMAAELTGTKLDVMAMNSATDTTELLGGYEQVDLRRPWNDLKGKVKHEVLHLCRNLLLTKNVRDTFSDVKVLLHSLFVVDMENNTEVNQNQVDEARTTTMLDAVSKLTNLTDECISICDKYSLCAVEFGKLKVALTELCSRLGDCNGNPHVSGQFEWVDGQLVLALKQGYWLLIDNVNFCSPSVLDRLNGLLEPGGVLYMNERGVFNGKIPVVHPHPNFRLILALAPKHGEISRAMRNRGVEIFLMGEENGDTYSQHDLHGILQGAGCSEPKAVKALMNFHDVYRNSVGVTVSKIVQATSLLNKLMERGVGLETGFAQSVRHVYGESQVPDIDESRYTINKYCMDTEITQTPVQLPSATFFQKDSVVAMIQHHAIPVMKTCADTKFQGHQVGIAMKIFLEWCNERDWQLRLQWLHSNFSSSQQSWDFTNAYRLAELSLQEVFTSSLFKQLYAVYLTLDKKYLESQLQPAYQPFNIRVNGPLYDYLHCKLKTREEISIQLSALTSRLHLLWLHLPVEVKMKLYVHRASLEQDSCSLLNLSIAFSEGLVNLENLPHPGIVHLYPFCRAFNGFLRHLIEASDAVTSDEATYTIWTFLRHYRQFFVLCDSHPRQDEDLQSLFGLYWKIFKDKTLCTIFQTFAQDEHQINVPDEMLSVTRCLDEMFTCENKLAESHLTMVAEFGHPTRFVLEEVCVLWETVTKLHLDFLSEFNMTENGRLSLLERRELRMMLVKNMGLLLKLREDKARKETAEEMLASIDTSVRDIKQVIFGHKVVDGSPPTDVMDQLSRIALRDESRQEDRKEIFNCDVLQTLCSSVADCSLLECLSSLTFVGLCEKLNSRTDVEYIEDWNEQLRFHLNYCEKFIDEISLNTAFIRYLLFDGKNKKSSMLQLVDGLMLHMDISEIQPSRRGNVLSLENSCFVCPFQLLHFPVDVEQPNNMLNLHPPLRLADVEGTVIQYENLASFLWLNLDYLGNLRSSLSNADWKLVRMSFIRFLRSAKSITSREIPETNEIFNSLLKMWQTSTSNNELWNAVHCIVESIMESYGRICNYVDIQTAQECFEGLLYCLKESTAVEPEQGNRVTNLSSQSIRGLSWAYLGLLQMIMFRPVGNVDPVQESNVRIRHLKEEVDDVENELNVRFDTEEMLTGIRIDRSSSDQNSVSFTQVNPSHVANLLRYRVSSRIELAETGEETAFRPSPSKFRKIVDIIQHFSASIGDHSAILDLLNKLCRVIVHPADVNLPDAESSTKTKRLLVNLKTRTKSLKNFFAQLKEYVAYEDMLGPYMVGLSQILKGVQIITFCTEKMLKWKAFQLKTHQLKLIEASRPTKILQSVLPFSNTLESSYKKSERLFRKELLNGMEVLCGMSERPSEEHGGITATFKSQVRKQALQLLEQSVRCCGFTKPKDITLLKIVSDSYMALWLQHEEQRKFAEQEEASLYKFRTKVFDLDQSEEEQAQKEIAELFTNFDQEYTDTDPQSEHESRCLGGNKIQQTIDPSEISDCDVNILCRIHNYLVSSLPNACRVVSTFNQDAWLEEQELTVAKIMVNGYNLAANCVDMGNFSDGELIAGASFDHLFMSSLLAKSLSSCVTPTEKESDEFYNLFCSKRQNYDIYHDRNLKEIYQAVPILSRFSTQIQKLLQEWPEHPSLVQLIATINRILSFPVTSPLMKILTGLEILLERAQDWELNANRDVSMRAHLDQVTHLIVRWRKMELGYWSSLLDVCEERVSENANKWWFHINYIIQQYCVREHNSDADFKEFLHGLRQFMESCPLGEFSRRLRILHSFHCQINVDEDQQGDAIKTILGNVYSYYSQFEADVTTRILNARTPIESDLKDFVKIAKWKDVNFWAMKEAAKKSHYTLLKFMKKYQTALSVPVDKLVSAESHVLVEDSIQAAIWERLELGAYLAPLHFKDILEKNVVSEVNPANNSSIQMTLCQFFVKMRKLTQKAIATMNYETLSESLNMFTDEVINAGHVLHSIEIPDKDAKGRQEFRKHIHVRKKRALADLFKLLTSLGLSYRKGVALVLQETVKDPMLVEGEDIAWTISNGDKLINNSERAVSSKVVAVLKNSDEYYQGCVARSAVLQSALLCPSKELNIGDVNRIKGFSEQLRHITQTQRENLTTVGRHFSDLRLIYFQLERIVISSSSPSHPRLLPPQTAIAKWTVTLQDILETCILALQKVLLLLDTCPNSTAQFSPVPQRTSKLSKSCKQDGSFLQARKIITFCIEEVSNIKSSTYIQALTLYSLGTESGEKCGIFLATWSHYQCLKSSFNKLDVISRKLDEVIKLDEREYGLGKLAILLKEKVACYCKEFSTWEPVTSCTNMEDAEACPPNLRSKLMRANEGILLSFQEWLRRREKSAGNENPILRKEDPNARKSEMMEENYVIAILDGELSKDTSTLNIRERTEDLKSAVRCLRETIDLYYKNCNRLALEICWNMITDIIPFLCQYVLLVEYHFYQLLLCHRNTCKLRSVLLRVFSKLLQKGFCLPPDEEVGGHEAVSFEDNEDCGIGEGQGQKDVSDKIEDEEQLLGSKIENNKVDEEVEDEFVEEEEHGVEMSEDFEATAHDIDVQRQQQSDGSDTEDDNDFDQQFGDVGGEKALDERLWDGSNGDSDNESDFGQEERGTGDNAKAERDLVAKDENQGIANESGMDEKTDEEDEEEAIHELNEVDEDRGSPDDASPHNNIEREHDSKGEMDEIGDVDPVVENDPKGIGEDEEKGEESKADETDLRQDTEMDEKAEEGFREETEDENNRNNEDNAENMDHTTNQDEQNERDLDLNEEDCVSDENWGKMESERKGECPEATEDSGISPMSVGTSQNDDKMSFGSYEKQPLQGKENDLHATISQESGQDASGQPTLNLSSYYQTPDEMSSYRKQLNKSRADRTVGSSDEQIHKRPKVFDSFETTNNNQRESRDLSGLVEHLKGESEVYDTQVYDAATLEQQQQQHRAGICHNFEDDDVCEKDEVRMDEDWDLPFQECDHESDMKEENVTSSNMMPNKEEEKKEKSDIFIPEGGTGNRMLQFDDQEIGKLEQEKSSLHLGEIASTAAANAVELDLERCRKELESQLSKWRELREGTADDWKAAREAWHKYEILTSSHSQLLCEQLRIVMEPSVANKLRGDYRTGKRLNMRKVIPYIASQYRKDKIWLRRTKPNKRQYQILLAVDDSSSMTDNHSKQLAFESLAVITNAMTRLEAGEIAICSFGENVQLLHPFNEAFTHQSGANILRRFTFEQKKTKIAQLLDSCTSIMISARSRVQRRTGFRLDSSQLLLIVSDGRGIFLEGVEAVQRAVRKATEAGIFLVFVILDNPTNKNSVLDIRVPVFRPGLLPQLKPYIEQLPFPFYIILRDISALPGTLSDSLRQWFELLSNMGT